MSFKQTKKTHYNSHNIYIITTHTDHSYYTISNDTYNSDKGIAKQQHRYAYKIFTKTKYKPKVGFSCYLKMRAVSR